MEEIKETFSYIFYISQENIIIILRNWKKLKNSIHTSNMLKQLKENFWIKCRNIKTFVWRKKLKNSDFSVICNNCVGAMALHDLKQKFNTPTVNLWIKPNDYISFLEKLVDHCDVSNVVEIDDKLLSYPVGILPGNIKIFFQHYKVFEDAKQKWQERLIRLNYENLFVILIERDGCSLNDLRRFDELPFKNKVAIVHKSYPEIRCAWVYPNVENLKEVPELTQPNGLFGSRKYDKFPWVRLFNMN